MSTITRKEIIQKIALILGIPIDEVKSVVNTFLKEIIDHLSQGDRFEFRDFGVFEVVTRKQKIGRNPKKPKIAILIPEQKRVKFSTGKSLKKRVENSASN